jgi:hypothetical protein
MKAYMVTYKGKKHEIQRRLAKTLKIAEHFADLMRTDWYPIIGESPIVEVNVFDRSEYRHPWANEIYLSNGQILHDIQWIDGRFFNGGIRRRKNET